MFLFDHRRYIINNQLNELSRAINAKITLVVNKSTSRYAVGLFCNPDSYDFGINCTSIDSITIINIVNFFYPTFLFLNFVLPYSTHACFLSTPQFSPCLSRLRIVMTDHWGKKIVYHTLCVSITYHKENLFQLFMVLFYTFYRQIILYS